MVHLYSGRRRIDDFQAMVEEILVGFSALGVRLLSVDTAVHDQFNVHHPKLWTFLLDIATGTAPGSIAGTSLRNMDFS